MGMDNQLMAMTNYSNKPLLNKEYVDSLWAIDNGETFGEIIEISREIMPVAIEELAQTFKIKDLDSLEIILHKLKGSAGTIGAQKMESLVEEIRLAAKEPSYDSSKDLEQLRVLANQSLKALSETAYK